MGLRILLVDDHPIVRHGLFSLLNNEPFVENVNSSGDAETAFEILKCNTIDLAIVDISLPGMNGIELIRAARQSNIATAFVILSFHNDQEFIDAAFESGAMGYILKEDTESDIHQCIDCVSAGKRYLSKSITLGDTSHLDQGENKLKSLTHMEAKILSLVGQYLTSKEIASRLNVTVKTVQNHRANVVNKLELSGSNALLQFALSNEKP
jgi:two-component system nitrate/nitrite response regulator NarL